MHYRNAGGAWKAIDNTLQVDAAGALKNTAGPLQVGLPALINAAPVRVAAGDSWVSFALQNAAASPARRSGASATYAGALPGVDVRYDVEGGAVKESLVLADANAASSFRWTVKTSSGVTAARTAAGEIAFSEGGERVFAPWMKDSAPAPARSSKVAMALEPVQGGYELVLAADRAWLQAPEREFPMVVDPTVSYARLAECELYEATPTTSGCGDRADFNVGLDAASKKVRSLVEFDLSSIPAAVSVREAKLKLISTRTSAPAPVGVHALTLVAILAVGLAALIKHQAGAILAYFLGLFIAVPAFGAVAGGAEDYSPFGAAAALTGESTHADELTAWGGGLLLAGWAFAAFTAGLLATQRRDIS